MSEDINLVDYARLPVKWGKLAIGAFLLISSLVFAASYLETPQYRSTVAFFLQGSRNPFPIVSLLLDRLNEGDPFKPISNAFDRIGPIRTLLESSTISERVVTQLRLTSFFFGEDRNDPASLDRAVRMLKRKVRLEKGRGERFFYIHVVLSDPVMAATIANEYVSQIKRLIDEMTSGKIMKQADLFEWEREKGFRDYIKTYQETVSPFTQGPGGETVSENHSFASLDPKYQGMRRHYYDLISQNEKARMDAARQPSFLEVVDTARVSDSPYKANRIMFLLLSCLAGFVGSFLAVFSAEFAQINRGWIRRFLVSRD